MTAKYRKYLQSNKWKQIREVVIERDGYKCQECGSQLDLQVHHKNYEHIYNEIDYPDDLTTLCVRCHYKKHRKRDDLILSSGNKMFRKVFSGKPDLSKAYLGYLYMLIDYLEQDSNKLIERKMNNSKLHHIEIDRERMADLLDVSARTLRRFLSTCQEQNVILQCDNAFYMNPTYAMNGNKIPVLLADLFDIETRKG